MLMADSTLSQAPRLHAEVRAVVGPHALRELGAACVVVAIGSAYSIRYEEAMAESREGFPNVH